MKKEEQYIGINRESWNRKTEIHLKSDFYNVENFIKGATSLNSIELELLGDIKGKSVLHLQCHFGQDSIALSRMGADVTGIDLSDAAIDNARILAKQCHTDTKFICCNVYDLPEHLSEIFDIVFTSYGTIGWLPDLDKWAAIISSFLKPGGKFIFAEFHPVVWMFNDAFSEVSYNYFNSGAIIETLEGTYADKNADLKQEYVMWNHGLSEVLNSLLTNGLQLHTFNEFDYSPYNCFQNTIEFSPGKFRIKHFDNKVPMVYALIASKTSQ